MSSHGGNIYKTARDLKINRDDIIDFSSNINPSGLSPILKDEIVNNIEIIKNYPDPDYHDLKVAIAQYNKISHPQITVGNGATELIYLYPGIIKPGKVLIIAPTFSEYARAAQLAGTEINYFEIKESDDYFPDINELEREISRGYDFIWLCNPNNPTGKFIELNSIEKIIASAAKTDTFILLDESFIEFIDRWEDKSSMNLIDKYTNLIILRSLTKFFAIPGIRLGYAICGNEKLNREISARREPWTINLIADLSGRVMLEHADYIKKTREVIHTEKNYLSENLKKLEWLKVYKTDVNFILLKFLSAMTSYKMKEILLKDRILIRDASNFKFLNTQFIRVAVRDRESNEMLLESLGKI